MEEDKLIKYGIIGGVTLGVLIGFNFAGIGGALLGAIIGVVAGFMFGITIIPALGIGMVLGFIMLILGLVVGFLFLSCHSGMLVIHKRLCMLGIRINPSRRRSRIRVPLNKLHQAGTPLLILCIMLVFKPRLPE
jgi:hypothetical protein